MANRYLSTNKLIENIKTRGFMPDTLVSFTDQDFLDFANEEMDIGIVPHILQYHQNYLLRETDVKLIHNISKYPIPHRAVGNKLNDVAYIDLSNNIYELTRLQLDDLPYEQWGTLATFNTLYRGFYVSGNEINLVPVDDITLDGYLRFYYYCRPNQLVTEDRVAIIQSIDYNKGIITVDKIPMVFQGITTFDITSSKSPYKITAMDIVPTQVGTTSNLTFTFGLPAIYNMTCSPKSSVLPGSYVIVNDNTSGLGLDYSFWFDTTGSDTPAAGTRGTLVKVDLTSSVTASDVAAVLANAMIGNLSSTMLASTSGGILILQGAGQGVSVGQNFSLSSQYTQFTVSLPQGGTNFLPMYLYVGDVLALQEETIIPQIPVELHSMLSQRVVMRCLEALGDTQGLQNAAAKLQEMEFKTGAMLDDRVEGAPEKIVNRHSFLRLARRYIRR